MIWRAFKTLLSLLFLVVVTWSLFKFYQANQESVRLYFLNYRTQEVSLGLLVMLIFTAGLVLSAGVFFSVVVAANLETRRIRKEIAALQRVLNEKVATDSSASTTPVHQKS